jgi:outer membrane protein
MKRTPLCAVLLALLLTLPFYAVGANPDADSGTGRTLEDFFTAAMEYSPSLQIAEERLKIGSARVRAANGQLLPQVSASASISDNRQTTMGNLTTYRGERHALQLRQVLFDWGVFSRRGQAYAQENQYESEYYAQLAQLLTEVAEKYLDVLEAEDTLASSDSELNAVRTQLAQIERLYGLQMVQITDLYEAQARLAIIEAERLYLSSEVTLAREALRSATGLAVGSIYTLDKTAGLPVINGTVDEWVQRARQGNHVIQARQYALEAADRRVSEQRGASYPRVNLIVQQQRSNLGFDNMPINRTDTNYVGLDVSIPLFTGGSVRAGVSEAISMQSIAQSELRQVNLEISERTRMAYLRLNSNALRIQAAERIVESATVAANAKRRGFELGSVTSVEVLDAVRNRFVAERDLQRSRYEHIRLGLYLRREAGTLSPDDLIDISTRMRAPEL